MKRAAALLLLLACAGEPDHELADWRIVLARKKALSRATPNQMRQAKQSYIDSLRDFCRRYPSHSRARDVYRQAELDFARELFARGDNEQAVPFFESVLREVPNDQGVRRELATAMQRRFLTPEALEKLRKGMRTDEVARLLGRPLPGWERTLRKGDRTVLSWHYRRKDGGVGGVHFVDGRLFAADYDKTVRLAR